MCCIVNDINLSLSTPPHLFISNTARREQAHPGTAVLLEERLQAQRQHLHRRQPGVRVCPLHPVLPHLTQPREGQSILQPLRSGDRLPSLQPEAHRNHLSCSVEVPDSQRNMRTPYLTSHRWPSVKNIVFIFLLKINAVNPSRVFAHIFLYSFGNEDRPVSVETFTVVDVHTQKSQKLVTLAFSTLFVVTFSVNYVPPVACIVCTK